MTQHPADPGPQAPTPRERATTVTGGTRIIGTYEIEMLISAGGMGEVYRGHNIHNGEPVAIKIVLPSLAHDPKIVALFQKESTTLSRLSHEAIVRYHVFTNDPQIGRPCLVMEFVSGTPMSERIEQGPMPLAEVKVMLARVASGLDKAHRAGVVHRDMSPDNIILEEGLVEHAKLIDFGIAKSAALGAGTLLQGQFAGKFNWVAPEQLGAFGGQVDGRSDIYSLALVAAGASRGAVLEMGDSIVDAVGKRSSVPDLTGVDPALVPLLSWMLNPNPANRPESMAQVIAALDDPALVPAPLAPAGPNPNATQISALPPHAGAGLAAAESFDASPFTASAAPAAPPPPAPAANKKPWLLPLVAAVLVLGGAGAYFSGAFAPAPPKAAPETVAAVAVQPAPEPAAAVAVQPAPAPAPIAPQPQPAESVAAPAPAATAPVPATPALPALLAPDALRGLLAQAQDCGPLRLANAPAAGFAETDPVQIEGRVASVAAQAALADSVAKLAGPRPQNLNLETLNPAICSVLNALPVLASGGFSLSLGYGDSADPNQDGHYVTGQNPVIDVALPAEATTGWLSIAILDGSGQVLHLLPNANRPQSDIASLRNGQSGALSLRVAFPIADAALPDSYRPAFVVNAAGLGQAIIVVLRADAPIDSTTTPSIEPVADFVQRLKGVPLTSLDQRLLTLTAP